MIVNFEAEVAAEVEAVKIRTETIKYFDIVRVPDHPDYVNQAFAIFEHRKDAEASLARQKSGVVNQDGVEIPYHWEIHESQLTEEQFYGCKDIDAGNYRYPDAYRFKTRLEWNRHQI
jgi:hypothetical protein